MLMSVRGIYRQGGFTLLEVLVVVVILAVAAAAALTTLTSRSSQLDDEAGRLALLLERLALEARISGSSTAWRCDREGRSISLWRWQPEVSGEPQPSGSWQAHSDTSMRFRGEIAIAALAVNGKAVDCSAQRVIFPAVSAAPELLISLSQIDTQRMVTVRGDVTDRFAVIATQ